MLSEVHCPKSMGQWAIVSKNNWTSDYAWTSDFGLPPDPTKSVIRNPKFNAVDTPCFVVIINWVLLAWISRYLDNLDSKISSLNIARI